MTDQELDDRGLQQHTMIGELEHVTLETDSVLLRSQHARFTLR